MRCEEQGCGVLALAQLARFLLHLLSQLPEHGIPRQDYVRVRGILRVTAEFIRRPCQEITARSNQGAPEVPFGPV